MTFYNIVTTDVKGAIYSSESLDVLIKNCIFDTFGYGGIIVDTVQWVNISDSEFKNGSGYILGTGGAL